MVRTMLVRLMMLLSGLVMMGASEAGVLWSADFETPSYTVDTYLTGQQGWWHTQGYNSGWVFSSGGNEKAQLGAGNGYGQAVCSPYATADVSTDKRFRIAMTITPGAGSDVDEFQIHDNSGATAISLIFDNDGYIKVRGAGNNGAWQNSGVAFTPGIAYLVEIIKDDVNWTFDLSVNSTCVLRNIGMDSSGEHAAPGIGFLYFVGGGNNGTPIANQCIYLDNITVEALPEFDRIWSANFETPPYVLTTDANTYLSDQQGWWGIYSNQGMVVSYSGGQCAEIGCWNGYGQVVSTPWFNQDTSGDKRYRVSMKFWPGSGPNQSDEIRVKDNSEASAIIVIFDRTTGRIWARGTDGGTWSDIGIAYTAGTGYWLDIYKNDNDHTFSLAVNGTVVLRNLACNVTSSGIGYIYFNCGGNNGTYVAGQYAYVDDVAVDVLSDVEIIWLADFETSAYLAGNYLTGQQGWWWDPNTRGLVVSSGGGQKAEIGSWNGYGQAVLSPAINVDTTADKKFRIVMTVKPGSGSDTDEIDVIDNVGNIAVYVIFDQASGHIKAKGNSGSWQDTGVTFTSGTDYRLEILKDDTDHTFSLAIDNSWKLRSIATGLGTSGIGYFYIYGGGNNGTPIANQYTYLDDMMVQIPSQASQYAWPVGHYDRVDYHTSISEMASEGTNITVGYHYPQATDEDVQAWLDQAHLKGLRVILETPRGVGTTVIDPNTTLITNYINKFKNHPAVYGWYIADEPDDTYHTTCRNGYNLIKTLSTKPVFICFFHWYDNLIVDFADSYDILLFDCYLGVSPYAEFYYLATNTFQDRIKWGSSHARTAGKPWWVVLQGHGSLSEWPDHRLLTMGEQRFMLYYCICLENQDTSTYTSTVGWLSWCHYLCLESPAVPADAYPYSGIQWLTDVYKPVAAEVNILGPAMSNGAKTGLTDNQSTTLNRLFQDPVTSEYYIIAVNNYTGTRTTQFTCSSPINNFSYARPLFEGSRSDIAITGSPKRFSDSFTPYQVHVYKLIP